MPQQSLRAYLVSGVSIVVECRADIVVYGSGVHEIRRHSSFQVIENKWSRGNEVHRNGMSSGRHGSAHQASRDKFRANRQRTGKLSGGVAINADGNRTAMGKQRSTEVKIVSRVGSVGDRDRVSDGRSDLPESLPIV